MLDFVYAATLVHVSSHVAKVKLETECCAVMFSNESRFFPLWN